MTNKEKIEKLKDEITKLEKEDKKERVRYKYIVEGNKKIHDAINILERSGYRVEKIQKTNFPPFDKTKGRL
jgi:hypothetical protein